MILEVGKRYKIVDDDYPRKTFSFGYEIGVFIGRTATKWPRFILDVKRGTQCAVNAQDICFEEVIKEGLT